MHTLTALLPLLQRGLDALPPVDLVEADEETCDLVAALYDPLDDPSALDRDVRGSLLAKVLHRKRPGLVPLFDSKVQMFYQNEACVPPAPKNGRTVRQYMGLLVRAMRQDLRDNADEFAALARLVPEDWAADHPAARARHRGLDQQPGVSCTGSASSGTAHDELRHWGGGRAARV
jgi:hypothetical protein